MRLALLVVVALGACGPSAAELRSAREATYATDPKRLLQVAMEAANDLYGIGVVDLEQFTFVTKSFFKAGTMSHRGWAGEWRRGGWRIEVRTTDDGRHSFVTIIEIAQRSLTVCKRCQPSWIDVAPDDVGLAPDLDLGRDKLTIAIHDRASRMYASR